MTVRNLGLQLHKFWEITKKWLTTTNSWETLLWQVPMQIFPLLKSLAFRSHQSHVTSHSKKILSRIPKQKCKLTIFLMEAAKEKRPPRSQTLQNEQNGNQFRPRSQTLKRRHSKIGTSNSKIRSKTSQSETSKWEREPRISQLKSVFSCKLTNWEKKRPSTRQKLGNFTCNKNSLEA